MRVEPERGARRFEEVEVAVAVRVEEHGAARGRPREFRLAAGTRRRRRQRGGGRVGERDFGRALVNEVGFGAGRGDGLGVATLFEVVLPDDGRGAALAERLKLLDEALPLFALARAQQRRAEVVERGAVVRLFGERGAEGGDGLRVLALLRVELADLHVRAHVARVDLQHALERGERVVGAVLGLGEQAEDVVRLRRVGRGGGGGARLLQGARGVRHVAGARWRG